MMPSPLGIVIFGASGDLTARKLIPALYHLCEKGRLPDEARIVGVARSPLSDDEFRARLGERLGTDSKDGQPRRWDDFARRIFYVSADAGQTDGMARVEARLADQEKHGGGPGASRRLYYLAVAPDLYEPIITQLGHAGMNRDDGGWRRLIIEKPFGHDLASAREVNRMVHEYFREDQVYRIDHYLGKETVQNLLVFRFANAIFEPIWNHQYIDHVQITVTETVPVGRRGDYYDRAGVLRDMMQSHLLQLLTLVTMEAPSRFAATPVRNEKVKVLEAIPVPTVSEAGWQVVGGQYAGYLGEPGVAPRSRTPTYAALRLQVDNWRWQGVPFYLRSGKALGRRYSEVVIQFRSVPHMMFPLPKDARADCDRLVLCIQPDEGIRLTFQSKVPDEGMAMRPATMEFYFRNLYAEQAIPEAYERLLQDAIQGDATLFMRSDEIERAWEIMDPLIGATERQGGPVPETYAVGSHGPAAADAFLARDGRTWAAFSSA
jgi:glucose-6-phosphate 1-dehydrogenase